MMGQYRKKAGIPDKYPNHTETRIINIDIKIEWGEWVRNFTDSTGL